MGDLSENFSMDEFRCKGENCCDHAFNANYDLIRSLQLLRDLAGKPIHINCGYRCAKHNHEVGGVFNSYHILGDAADIVIQGLTVDQMAGLAEQVPRFAEGGIGKYPARGFIHVDVRKGRARWTE